jgi:RHS repeat-associated protein
VLLASYSYQLHPTGRRTNAVEVLLNTDDNTYVTNTHIWQYDGLYHLTNEVTTSSSSTLAYTNTFQYNLAGNRVKQTRGAETITYAYDNNDQLNSEQSSVSGQTTYLYDVNGSLTNKAATGGTASYTYNLANKLSSVTANGSTTYYLYNDSGIRVHSLTGTSTNLYLVDANNHTGFAQVLEELTAPNTPATTSYVLGDDVLAQCGPTPSDPAYLLYDGHGSTRQLVHGVANVTSQFHFEAYGQSVTTLPSNPETTMLYCGEQYDTTLKMYNLRARYYNPSNGRFNAMDSHMGNKYDPQSLHRYLYANSDPVNGMDPSGNETMVELMVACSIATGLEALYTAALASAGASSLRALEKVLYPLVPIKGSQVPAFHKELAQLCLNVYDNPPRGTGNWQSATQHDTEALGLRDSVWSGTAFFAHLFIGNGNSYVLAYRGTATSGLFDIIGDWYTNIAQGAFGPALHTQYDEATALADQVNAAVGNGSLTMTGHSLGGGLASAAAFETDRPCVTFNAAALNELSYIYYRGFMYSSEMVNYTVKGEVLTTLQRHVFLAPATTFCQQYVLEPASDDAKPDAGGTGLSHMIYLHGMDRVINALNAPD